MIVSWNYTEVTNLNRHLLCVITDVDFFALPLKLCQFIPHEMRSTFLVTSWTWRECHCWISEVWIFCKTLGINYCNCSRKVYSATCKHVNLSKETNPPSQKRAIFLFLFLFFPGTNEGEVHCKKPETRKAAEKLPFTFGCDNALSAVTNALHEVIIFCF